MAASLDTLTRDALTLPEKDRVELARIMFESVENEYVDPEYQEVIRRRIEELKSGAVRAIPAAEAFARLRRIAPDP